MNRSNKVSHSYRKPIIILSTALLILIYYIFHTPTFDTLEMQTPMTAITSDFSILKNVALDRIQYIKNKSGFLKPYNKNVMDIVSDMTTNATTLNNLAIASMLLPNSSIGMYPLDKLGNAADTNVFQFEQGGIGWYWGYGTYPSASIMFYIIRIELGNPDVRRKYNLPIGSTTVYSLSFGVGSNGQWLYSPFCICGGSYIALSNKKFMFSASDPITKVSTVFTGDSQTGTFNLDFSFMSTTGIPVKCTTSLSQDNPSVPHLNAPYGCAPCISGAGTLYWSYTQLNTSSSISIGQNPPLIVDNGDGWMDKQWMRGGDPKQVFLQCLSNISQVKAFTGGLGRYIWLNLHITTPSGTKIQYMLSCFPDQFMQIASNQSFDAKYNIYSDSLSSPVYSQQGRITITDVQVVQGITFPKTITTSVKDLDGVSNIYTIDTSAYGDTVTIDLTGNFHWSGSATLSSASSGFYGTAFVEANQFETASDYMTVMLQKGGVSNPQDASKAFSGGALKKSQIVVSVFILILPILILAVLIILLLKK